VSCEKNLASVIEKWYRTKRVKREKRITDDNPAYRQAGVEMRVGEKLYKI